MVICIKLKRSKCDQFGTGVTVYLGRTDSPLCPVTALLAYMASRQDSPGPFFRDDKGHPLTKAVFVRAIPPDAVTTGPTSGTVRWS